MLISFITSCITRIHTGIMAGRHGWKFIGTVIRIWIDCVRRAAICRAIGAASNQSILNPVLKCCACVTTIYAVMSATAIFAARYKVFIRQIWIDFAFTLDASQVGYGCGAGYCPTRLAMCLITNGVDTILAIWPFFSCVESSRQIIAGCFSYGQGKTDIANCHGDRL